MEEQKSGNPWISIAAYFNINGIKVSKSKELKVGMEWLDFKLSDEDKEFIAYQKYLNHKSLQVFKMVLK